MIRSRIRHWCAGLALCGLLVSLSPLAFSTQWTASAAAPAAIPQAVPELPPELQRARERWEELTVKERQRVRANYRRWKEMGEEQRVELRRRAQRMSDERDEVERELPADVKRDLSRLDQRKQRQVLRDLAEARVKENGRRIRSQMPEDFMLRLEAAPPAARPELLQKFKRTQRGRVARAALETLGHQLELPPAEIARLQELPEDRRTRAVLELRQRLSERDLREDELPHGLTWEQWDAWSRLSPEDFFGRIVEFRQRRVDALEGRRTGEGRGPTPADPAPPGASRAGPRPRSDRDAPLPRVLKRLAEAVSPNPRDALELIELSRPERKEGMARRRRYRCMQLIQGEHLLPAERVREIERLSNEEFFDLVRQILVHTGHIESSSADSGDEDG